MKDMLTKKELCEVFSICPTTARTKISRIEQLMIKGRYPRYSVVRNGKILLVNAVVFLDYLDTEPFLKDKNLAKHAPKFDYDTAKKMLNLRRGYEQRTEDTEDYERTGTRYIPSGVNNLTHCGDVPELAV